MSECCGCGKTIDVARMQAKQRRVLTIVLAINLATFVMMVMAAWLSHSSSLLSGGLDNLGDALTYAISLAVVAASTRVKAQVALLKAALILGAAVAVGAQIVWRLANPALPLFDGMGIAAALNLGANGLCLYLLTPYRNGDINLASAWECARNDIFEGVSVLVAALMVWLFGAGWPDLLIAAALLVMFLRSSLRIFRASLRELKASGSRLSQRPRLAATTGALPTPRTRRPLESSTITCAGSPGSFRSIARTVAIPTLDDLTCLPCCGLPRQPNQERRRACDRCWKVLECDAPQLTAFGPCKDQSLPGDLPEMEMPAT